MGMGEPALTTLEQTVLIVACQTARLPRAWHTHLLVQLAESDTAFERRLHAAIRRLTTLGLIANTTDRPIPTDAGRDLQDALTANDTPLDCYVDAIHNNEGVDKAYRRYLDALSDWQPSTEVNR